MLLTRSISSPQISVAAVAVTCRGYVSMLNRTRESKAHKKLGDLYRRWQEAERLIAPIVETLPQLLILPVLLFIIGLLDNMISSALPLSSSSAPVLVAGLLSAMLAVATGAYTIWTVVHGCKHPHTSPYQSTVVQIVINRHNIWRKARNLPSVMISRSSACYSSSRTSMRRLTAAVRRLPFVLWRAIYRATFALASMFRRWLNMTRTNDGVHPAFDTYHGVTSQKIIVSMNHTTDYDDKLEEHEIMAYYNVIQFVHEDEILDEAIVSLSNMLKHYTKASQGHIIKIARHLFSPEVSIKTNLTAATVIGSSQHRLIIGKDYLSSLVRNIFIN